MNFSTSSEWNRLSNEEKRAVLSCQVAPPVNISQICALFRVDILSSPLPNNISGEIRANPIGDGFTIKINRYESEARQRFTAAHELAHYFLHRDQIADGGIVDSVLYRSKLSTKLEAEANRLAKDILMPALLMHKHHNSLPSGLTDSEIIERLCSDFKVSKVAMSIRLGMQ
jgi:IrrE N-terminal-like domain